MLKDISANEWNGMSEMLHITHLKMDQIRAEYQDDGDRKKVVIDEYVINYPLASWSDICQRLQLFGYVTVAESVRAKYTGKKTAHT